MMEEKIALDEMFLDMATGGTTLRFYPVTDVNGKVTNYFAPPAVPGGNPVNILAETWDLMANAMKGKGLKVTYNRMDGSYTVTDGR